MDTDVTLIRILAVILLLAIPVGVWAWTVWLARWRWRQKGIGFAEGWFMVVDRREGKTLQRPFYPGQRQAPRPAAETPDTATPPEQPVRMNSAPAEKYTITGRPIR